MCGVSVDGSAHEVLPLLKGRERFVFDGREGVPSAEQRRRGGGSGCLETREESECGSGAVEVPVVWSH